MGTMDEAILLAINRGLAGPAMDALMGVASSRTLGLVVLLAATIVLVWRGGRRGRVAAVAMVLAVSLTDPLAAQVLKPLIGRARPCHELGDAVRVVAGCGGPWSMPSNHAANLAAAAAAMGSIFPRTFVLSLPLALVIGLSRVYLGVHYPSDVLAGWALGAVVGLPVARGLIWLADTYRRATS